MGTTINPIRACTTCGLPLPIRAPRAGEAGATWVCCYCNSRFFGVLDDLSDPEALTNVAPAQDVNPRVIMAGQTLETLHKRRGVPGRSLDERGTERQCAEAEIHINLGGERIETVTRDLSTGGFSVILDRPVEVSTVVSFSFLPPHSTATSRAIARHCTATHGGAFCVGFEILPYP